VEDMLGALRGHRPGERVSLKLIRDGKETSVEVTLGSFPG
jgi:S1-C subfamily serine protease